MDAADRPDQSDPGAERPAHPEPLLGPALTADATAGARFGFVEVEVPWPLGPPDGRYALRGGSGAISHVVVVATLGAARRRASDRVARRRAVAEDPGPAPVAIGRATVIAASSPFADAAAADAWLARAGEPEVADALRALARLLAAHRLAAADPTPAAVGRGRLLAARVGWGDGDALAAGRFARARALPARGAEVGGPRRRGSTTEQRLAALLGGRDASLACEELVLRARLDLDEERPREAALQVLVALDAAIAELPRAPGAAGLADRLADLRERRSAVAGAAQEALSGPPSPAASVAVAEAVGRLEAALRARAMEIA